MAGAYPYLSKTPAIKHTADDRPNHPSRDICVISHSVYYCYVMLCEEAVGWFDYEGLLWLPWKGGLTGRRCRQRRGSRTQKPSQKVHTGSKHASTVTHTTSELSGPQRPGEPHLKAALDICTKGGSCCIQQPLCTRFLSINCASCINGPIICVGESFPFSTDKTVYRETEW